MSKSKKQKIWPERKKIQKAYDKIYRDEKVFSPDSLDDKEKKKAASLINDFTNLNVLDVACGDGKLFKFIPRDNNKIYGIDISSTAIKACKKNYPFANSKVGIAEELPYIDNYFDVVFCLGSLEHFMNIKKALKEIKRVLKKNGLFIALIPARGYFIKQAIYRYLFPNFYPIILLKRLLYRLSKFKKLAIQPQDKGFSQKEIISLFKRFKFDIKQIIKFPENKFSFEFIIKMKNL